MPPPTLRRWSLLVAVALAIAGCSLLGSRAPAAGPYPEACERFELGERRCAAVVSRAAESVRLDLDDPKIEEVRLLPGEPGTRQIAVVEFVLDGGSTLLAPVACVGVSSESNRACREDARLRVAAGINSDVPCTGEPPEHCATLPPSPRPASVAAARPLELATFSVEIDRLGGYRVEVGRATLPDGVMSERRLELVDPAPIDFWIDDGILLEVAPEIPGRPDLFSIYRDPYDGPEPVRVFLVFEVTELISPSVLEVRDIVVR